VRKLAAAVLSVACGFIAPSFADDPNGTRDIYDAYVDAFTLQQHLESCERHAPAALEQSQSTVAAFRATNEASLRRLEAAARKWRLPGDRSIEEVLRHIRDSTDAYYADVPAGIAASRCQNLVANLAASSVG